MERLFNLDAQLLFDACVMALSMLVMFTFLSYLLFKPVRKLLEDRKQRVADEQESATNDRKEEAVYKEEYELERKRALDDMKQEMIAIASAMAGKVVAASIDTSVQDELIEETLKEMGEQTWLS